MFAYQVDEHIQLRQLEPRFAEDLFQLIDRNRTYLREWLPWVDGTLSPKDTSHFIQLTLNQIAANNGFQTGIFYQGVIAGCIGLHRIDWGNQKTSIGYWLAAEFQGRGIMTKACKAMIDHIFNELELNRVEIRAAVKNRKSRAIPERLGFTQEGTIRRAEWLYDHYVDHVVYGLLKEEWVE